ncbi:MAG TPA: glycosyltransferase [Solirubrobacterales bacterium]|nr:glycosyltransferase [Solirubrobacterales bacterium]
MTRPTVGLAIVARDEEATLPRLLASVVGAFDQVALLDTGSEDRTVEVFEAWAVEAELPLGHRVGSFAWRDDFAAARNAAVALLETDWFSWADADNVIEGSERLRTIAECARPEVAALAFPYDYWPGGLYVRTEPRLVRRGRGRWEGRLHETLVVDGEVEDRGGDWALWIHTGRPPSDGSPRNLAIARRWAREEPENEQARATLDREEALAVGCANSTKAPPRCANSRGLGTGGVTPMHDDRIRQALDREARYAERLTAETGDSGERLVKLDGQVIGRARHVDTLDGEGGGDFGWKAEYWSGERFEECAATLLAEADDLEEADRFAVGEIAEALTDDLAKPRIS